MPGCQSYALTSRSRSPLLLSLPQQTMNWEWKSVGKQGKYEKAPLRFWKKNPHRTLLSDNHIARLGTSVLYTKPVQDSFEIQEKIIFSAPGMKGQATPAMEMRGIERRGRAGMERKGRALESQAQPSCQGEKGHSDPPMAFQGSGRGKTAGGDVLQPFLSAVLALCLLFLF